MFSDDENELLERLHHAMPGLSIDALEIFWSAFRAEAVRRITVLKKPLDLGFVKIIAVPYRQNWKELAAQSSAGFDEAMKDRRMLAYFRGIIRWSIECVPSKDLVQAIDERENEHKVELGHDRYSWEIIYGIALDYVAAAAEIFERHAERLYLSSPRVLWQHNGNKVLAAIKPGSKKVNPTRTPVNAPGPSISSSEDKDTQSPDTSTCSQSPEIFSGPLLEEPPDRTGEVFG